MPIKAVIGFLISVFVLLIIGGVALSAVNASRGRKTRPGIILAVSGLVGALILGPLNAGLVLIQPNEVGVVFRQTSKSTPLLEPLQPGLSWVLPFVDQVIPYDVGQQSVTMVGSSDFGQETSSADTFSSVRAISSDGQVIFADITVIFRVNGVQINEIHRNWRGGYLDQFIIPQTRSEVRNAISEYGAEEIYSGGRAALETQIVEGLQSSFEREGFLLTDILIRDISFSPEFTDAIEQKQIAEQEAQRAAFRVQQAQQEAEQVRVEAKGQADAAVLAAEGEAKAIVLKAEADAEALRLINEILSENPNLLQYEYINRLGDKIQLIIIPSNSPFLFDLESLMDQAGIDQANQPALPPTSTPTPEPESGGDN